METNRVCACCGTKYQHCAECHGNTIEEYWKNAFDTENCRVIFRTLADYSTGLITSDEAKTVLSKCDLTKKNDFYPEIKNSINKIMGSQTAGTSKTTTTK